MSRRASFCSCAIFLCFCCILFGADSLRAKDKGLTAEQVVAAHLNSIGPKEVLASVKNRGISGQSLVSFIQGGVGKMSGQALVVSAGPNLALILKYGGAEYPGEYLAYDGMDVTIGTIKPGQRSPFGEFVFRYKQIMKEGLLGGVWSFGWPLLNLDPKKATLKYDTAKIGGKELHQIEYIPKRGMNDIKVKLYFEPETFRHVRTEYRLKVRGEQALQQGMTVSRNGATRDAGILDVVEDSNYLLIETFDNFKEVDKMTLPLRYTIEYSHEGQGSSFLANWTIQADKFIHNGQISGAMFIAQ